MYIALATLDSEIERCFSLMQELRPHLSEIEFVTRIRRQEQHYGYRLAYLETEAGIKALAGFRVSECLAWGRFLYVDDLVTRSSDRSQGYGHHLFEWLIDYAQTENCQEIHLDSGVQRFAAHRFYLNHRMDIAAHHFMLKLHSPR